MLAVMAAGATGQDPATRPDSRPLANEKSAYLRQHLDNPVAWHPWGEEAFAKAVREDKPIFLSIGYASCHWCHVMEHESFEDAEIARVLNEGFVSIKVDREERPDVDRVYLQAAIAMTGRGGWPLNLFLTPDRKPFYAGTYFPLEDQPNQTGFRTIVFSIRNAWRERRGLLADAADRVARLLRLDQLSAAEIEAHERALASRAAAEGATRPDPGPIARELDAVRAILARKKGPAFTNLLERAGEQLIRMEDREHGGFGDGMKFPMPASALALLRLYARGKSPRALETVSWQYDAMARGGIRDHLAGGFHRYATDRAWNVPHFEKMLYDQALIARVYLELLQATGQPRFEVLCRETLDFCLARMRRKDGGFIAAIDASVEGEEGATYLWSREEIEGVLAGAERSAFLTWAGFDHRQAGEKITIADRSLAARVAGESRGTAFADVEPLLRSARARLLAARDARPQPAEVPHALTSWNAWLASTLAKAGAVLNERRYLTAALETVAFLDRHLKRDDGLYARRHVEGETRFSGELSDQAAVVEALLDLHEATLDPAWLDRAIELAGRTGQKFGRPDGSFTDSVEPDLIFRTRDLSDGAVPSGISQMNVALTRIARMTGRREDLARARRAIDAVLPEVSEAPSDHAYGVIAWDLAHQPAWRIVFFGPRPIALLMRAPLLLSFRPQVVTTVPRLVERGPDDERASAVVWIDDRPSEPVFDSAALMRAFEAAETRAESR